MSLPLDQRPIVVAVAGPNGAGKTTFYHAHLQPAGLRFVNADLTWHLAVPMPCWDVPWSQVFIGAVAEPRAQ